MLGDASWWFAQGIGQLWTHEQDCLGEERHFPCDSSRWHLSPSQTCLWLQSRQKKKFLDYRPDSWASFPHKDRGVKYVQRVFSQRKIIVRKKKRVVGSVFNQIDIEKKYGVCIKYTKQLNLKESCYKSFCRKIRNNFLI